MQPSDQGMLLLLIAVFAASGPDRGMAAEGATKQSVAKQAGAQPGLDVFGLQGLRWTTGPPGLRRLQPNLTLTSASKGVQAFRGPKHEVGGVPGLPVYIFSETGRLLMVSCAVAPLETTPVSKLFAYGSLVEHVTKSLGPPFTDSSRSHGDTKQEWKEVLAGEREFFAEWRTSDAKIVLLLTAARKSPLGLTLLITPRTAE